MTLELKRYKTEPYRICRVVDIAGNNKMWRVIISNINCRDTLYPLTRDFEYVKDADTGVMYIENGKWVGDADWPTE